MLSETFSSSVNGSNGASCYKHGTRNALWHRICIYSAKLDPKVWLLETAQVLFMELF